AGVILSFVALGGALLMFGSGGSAIGWGFQLQSPVVVGLLAYLLFAMGLSLSGVADFGFGLTGVGGRFAGREGLGGAFATGILATIVATPCTAPFMGAALGFALLAPAPLALAIFVALGIGLAAPLAIATLIPGFARRSPRWERQPRSCSRSRQRLPAPGPSRRQARTGCHTSGSARRASMR